MPKYKINTVSIITAGLSGLAGGAALGSLAGPVGIVFGSAAAAVITGLAEYNREKKGQDNNSAKLIASDSKKEFQSAH